VIATPTRVLVVDDVDEIRMLLTLVLGLEANIEVVGEATNGKEAIELARQLKPDVVLLDVAMPVMSGDEALPYILDASPQSKVIVVSAFEARVMRDKVLALGAVAYVEKGFNPEPIVKAINDIYTVPSGNPDEPDNTNLMKLIGDSLGRLVHAPLTPVFPAT